MTKHETQIKINELVTLLNTLDVEGITAKIFVPNDNILNLLATDYNVKVYEPFEMFGNEERLFYYSKDKVTIHVKSQMKYRRETHLIEY
jgi:hypothetical protein